MSALRNTAAALALGLALPGAAIAACSDSLSNLKASYGSSQMVSVLMALDVVAKDETCSRTQIVSARRQAASVVAGLAQRRLAAGDIDGAEALIKQAPALHWAVQAVRGDIASKRGNRSEAAAMYNGAMDTLSDPSLTKQTPQLAPVAKKLAGLAQENMMLAGSSETSLARGGESSGVLRFVARGLAIEKVGAGEADPYKAEDYAVKTVDDDVKEAAPKVEYKEEEVKVYVAPKKEDYAVIDDTYKAIGDVFLPIRFAFNSDALDHAGFKEAERLAEFLNKHKVEKLTIEGHTDDVGSEQFNFDLSLRRATTLRDFLVSYGVYSRIHVEGKGETEPPIYTDKSIYSLEELRTIARRVEISFGF